MSTSLLFGAGAIVTFITVWGVVMAGGLFATRRLAPDDPVVAPESTEVPIGPADLESPSAVSPTPLRVVDG